MNFLKTSYELLTNFLRTSYELLTNFLRTSSISAAEPVAEGEPVLEGDAGHNVDKRREFISFLLQQFLS
jgi:hypothetical protein